MYCFLCLSLKFGIIIFVITVALLFRSSDKETKKDKTFLGNGDELRSVNPTYLFHIYVLHNTWIKFCAIILTIAITDGFHHD